MPRYDPKTRRVWMPVPKKRIHRVGAETLAPVPRDPAAKAENFEMFWYAWPDYPFKRGNLVEADGRDPKEGFGEPEVWATTDVVLVRAAYLLTETFELAQAGGARVADSDQVKDDLRVSLGRATAGSRQVTNRARILHYVAEIGDALDVPDYITSADIARATDMDAVAVGRELRMLFGVQPKRDHGYSTTDLLEAYAVMVLQTGHEDTA